MSKEKIGLFFGTFDPIHNGHLRIAKYITEEKLADKVWFVVTPENPIKVVDTDTIKSSFPSFFEIMNEIGAKLKHTKTHINII